MPLRRPPLVCLLASMFLATPIAPPAVATEEAEPAADEAPAPPGAPVVEETITVTATRSARPVEQTPGHVSVIGRGEIERRLAADTADLVRFEPGVYVDGDPTRLGLSGFNVRGIGGNRVMTRLDGVATADEFSFGPLAIHQVGLDVEALERVEIVRSAGSALYGSDALGGVVSLVTRDPMDYLAGGGPAYLGTRAGWDGRADEASESVATAYDGGRWQASLWLGRRDGEARDNQGTVDSLDDTRTAPNPIDRAVSSGLGKLTFAPSDASHWKLSAELFDSEVETEVLSGRGVQDLGASFGPGVTFRIDTSDFDARDSQRRGRLILENLRTGDLGLADGLSWRLWAQQDETDQRTLERRVTTQGGGFLGPLRTGEVERTAGFSFEQEGFGGEVEAHQELAAWGGHRLTYGAAASRQRFDTLRDRVDVSLQTGAVVPSSTPFPTKYFPASTVDEIGLFVQDEIDLWGGRLLVVPGLRWDRFDLDADQGDAVFLAGNPGTLPPADMSESAVSPRLGLVLGAGRGVSLFAQYARGFRAPSYSEVNNGFTHFALGYMTLPNPELEPETSDNVEAGVRWSGRRGQASATLFDNRYEGFIETATLGIDPATGLIVFQPQNLTAARIRGVELAGEARLGRDWRLRGAYAHIDGENEAGDLPLASIAPPQLVVGLGYRPAAGRWGAELAATVDEGKDVADLDRSVIDQFAAPAYEVLDLTGFVQLTRALRLDLALFNLTDETSWSWPAVRGVAQGSPAIDRYSQNGRAAAVALRFRP